MGSRPAGERRPRLVANELPFPHADPFRIGELEGRIAAADEVSAEVGVAGGLPGVLADQIDAPAHAICAARTPLWQTRLLNRITPPGSIGSATGKPGVKREKSIFTSQAHLRGPESKQAQPTESLPTAKYGLLLPHGVAIASSW